MVMAAARILARRRMGACETTPPATHREPARDPRQAQPQPSPSPPPMIFRRLPASSSFVLAAARLKAAKLRIGRVCQGCLIRWRVEAVGAEAGAGEEPQP